MSSNDAVNDTTTEDDGGPLRCPVCFMEVPNLQLLNQHLDDDHDFEDAGSPKKVEKIVKNELSLSPKIHKQIKIGEPISSNKFNQFSKAHWKPLISSKSVCNECGKHLKKGSNAINCRKCGELFCKLHCRNVIKLNNLAEYSPDKGSWYLCCHTCFTTKPGYNDFGTVVDMTVLYQQIRGDKIEDKHLRNMQLEQRLIKLVDGVIAIHRTHKNSIMMAFRVPSEFYKLERSLVRWKDDQGVINCSICQEPFNVLVRKHHCRLCGRVVCDEENTNCSSLIPIQELSRGASDLDFKQIGSDYNEIIYNMRVCSCCIQKLYLPRKFQKDIAAPPSTLFKQYDKLNDISNVISNSLPKFHQLLTILEKSKTTGQLPDTAELDQFGQLRSKLLKLFLSYNSTSKQIAAIVPRNVAETKIQQSVLAVSSQFIQEQLLPLKSIPDVINPFNVKSKDKNDGDVEVKTLSDLMINNLTLKEVKLCREELMVLNEQTYLVGQMVETATKQRKFEETALLKSNLSELNNKIKELQEKLGEEGF